MGAIGIPATIDDVSPAWLSAALSADPSVGAVAVTDVAVDAIGVGIGVMGLLYRLTPTYEGAPGPATVVAKMASQHEQTRQVARGYRFYEREVAVYRELGPSLRLRPPHAYYVGHDLESDDFVLLLEDLSGMRVASQIDGCTPEDALAVVRSLAAHHADWWESDALGALPFLQSPADPPYPQFHAQSTKEAWAVCREPFGDVIPRELHAVAERWAELGPAMMESATERTATLVHGDVRLDNVFFDDSSGEHGSTVSLVDWQIAFRNAGAFDVAYFLCQSMTVEDRRAHEDAILRTYHEILTAGGIDYSWDAFMDDYRHSVMFSFCYPLTGGASCDLVNERAVELVASMFERVSMAIVDHDATELLPG
jgi:hypothetical protein